MDNEQECLVDNVVECIVNDAQIEYPTNTFELALILLKLLHSGGIKLDLPLEILKLRKLLINSFPDYAKTHLLYLVRYRNFYKLLQFLSCNEKPLNYTEFFKLKTKCYNNIQDTLIKHKYEQLYNKEFNTNNNFINDMTNESYHFLNVTQPCIDIKLSKGIFYVTKIHGEAITILLESYDGLYSKIDTNYIANSQLVGTMVNQLNHSPSNTTSKILCDDVQESFIDQFNSMGNKIDFKSSKLKDQIVEMINKPTMNTRVFSKYYKNIMGKSIRQMCPYGTLRECKIQNARNVQLMDTSQISFCKNAHYRPIILPHTDKKIGACSYLDTCRHIENCRFVHYEIVMPNFSKSIINGPNDEFAIGHIYQLPTIKIPPQWINCDVRKIDFRIFNPYVKVIMADPPWDIHMDLPYGTLKDSEMKELQLKDVQDEGLLFLWVTGRSMELARECMDIWGYKRVEEILWIKINQLQRLVRTGRTGHWINHSKEHCLVGIKGNPNLNRNIDCDVILSEVRETSRKPDEIYRIIERMCPNDLKLEIFGRHHNTRNNWITLGNQLNGINIIHPEIKERLKTTSII
ncbi:MT-A70 [Babesia microti strain RI]|uniref:MT-A70 n=1 Tax=Babesia microti (strain RI) TaxID=1133968 RepID=A0A1N6LXG1_BABMR|nr:MT-A70 [Babesia microti strain RI]SIO73553.1 MT-A70 [Babesia microti strain RI]|eukprot:XP_021337642.1 MT-A70 [Babesia microti strain RI]